MLGDGRAGDLEERNSQLTPALQVGPLVLATAYSLFRTEAVHSLYVGMCVCLCPDHISGCSTLTSYSWLLGGM